MNMRLLKSPLAGILNNLPNRKKRYTLLFFLVLINSVDLQAQDGQEFNRARVYYMQKQYQEAVSVLDRIIKMNSTKSDLSKAYNLRGQSYEQMNRLNDAVMDFNQAIEFDPQNCRAYCNRGLIEFNRGDFKGAMADFNRGIEIDPQACPAYYDRGRLKEKINDFKGAITDFSKSIELDHNNGLAWAGRGLAKVLLGDFPGALADSNRSVQLNPLGSFVIHNRAYIKSKQGDYQGALEDLEEAYRLSPKDEWAREIENIKAKLTPSRTGGTTSGVDRRPAPLKDLPPPPPLR